MLKVVIGDDEKRICQLLKVLVDWSALGFEIVAEEYDGQSLLQTVRERKPDVLITDVRMPGYSGLELLHSIRQENLDIDVVIMSGYRQFDYVRTALKEGASDYLLKPLNREALNETLLKIKERYEKARKDKQHTEYVQKQLQSVSKKLHQNLVYRILDGNLKTASIMELNREYGCALEGQQLYFVTIKLDNDDYLVEKAEDIIQQKFQDIIEKHMKKSGIQYFYGQRQNFYYLFINTTEWQKLESCLYHLMYTIKDYTSKVRSMHVTIGVAPVEEDNLYQAYENSLSAVFDQIFKGTDRVLLYRPNKALPEDLGEPILNAGIQKQFRDALTKLSQPQLLDCIQNVLDRILKNCNLIKSGKRVYHEMCELQELLMKLCAEFEQHEEIEAVLARYHKHLNYCYVWSSYVQLFEAESRELIEIIRNYQSNKEKKPIRMIKKMIQERYMEELTLEDIAAEVELSTAYVSKIFKREMNITFVQYLNAVRLDKAKELLATTNYSAARIAEMVGYRDEKYFLRVFKKEVGLTTGEYRRLYGE